MSYSLKLERAILQTCLDWRFDPESARYDGGIFEPPESLSDFSKFLRPISTDKHQQWDYLRQHLEHAVEQGWLSKIEQPTSREYFNAKITGEGQGRLDWHESRTILNRATRTLAAAFRTLFNSVLVRVAAILVALMFIYLGLNKG
ncbi:hypothetical protein [Tropicimonas sp. IMCC34043]|uniref:hypothetical protein n=1 Tax=Tropicimonas sp. IMCC34043 TaxID=2248760 RepID=UPI00130050D0|nr:hypothetical protein [Tropicimonas sp. IMCC34043]